jgi:hypothetical protein
MLVTERSTESSLMLAAFASHIAEQLTVVSSPAIAPSKESMAAFGIADAHIE